MERMKVTTATTWSLGDVAYTTPGTYLSLDPFPESGCDLLNNATDPSKIPWAEICFYIFSTLHIVVAAVYIERATTNIALLTSLSDFGKSFAFIARLSQSIHDLALLLHLLAVAIVISVIVGVVGAANGYVRLLYAHCGMIAICLALELYASWRVGLRMDFCQKHFENFHMVLKYYISNYYFHETLRYKHRYIDNTTKQVVSVPVHRRLYTYSVLVDNIQRSMGCCGYNNYKDYVISQSSSNPFIQPPPKGSQSYNVSSVPSSCCQRIYANNIFCASKLSPDPNKLKKQIYTEGCAVKVTHFCDELIAAGGPGALCLFLIHFAILISSLPTVVIQLNILRTMQSRDLQYYYYNKESLSEYRYPGIVSGVQDPTDRILLQEFYTFIDRMREEEVRVDVVKGDASSGTMQNSSPIPDRPTPTVVSNTSQKPATNSLGLPGRASKRDKLNYSRPGPSRKK